MSGRKDLHQEYLFFKWIDLASASWECFMFEGRGAMWITDTELDINYDGLAAYVPLDDQDAQENLFNSEAIAALKSYDPSHEIVAIFQDDHSGINVYRFHAPTPRETAGFIRNLLKRRSRPTTSG
jgi:hypothetical protein